MKSFFRVALRHASFALLSASLPAFSAMAADVAPLTLADAQQRAVERSRQLMARTSAIDAAREMAVAAGQLPDPVLKLGVDNLPVNGPDRYSLTRDFMTMRRVGVMQEITRADKRVLRSERYEREADKARAEKSLTLAAVQRDTALAWLDRYYAEAMAAVLAEQAAQAKLEIQGAEAAYRGGRGSQADVLAARGSLAMLQDRTSEMGRRVGNARLMLARWIGEDTAALGPAPALDAIRLEPHSLDRQLAHHPDIAVLDEEARIAETEARLAEAEKQADWSMEVAYSRRGDAYADMVSVGLSIPLQWDQGRRQDREVAAKLARAEQARAEREEMLRGHAVEVKSMVFDWQSGRERSARYQKEILPLAGQRVEATLAAYRGGKASLDDVLAARRGEIELRLQALQLELETARLWAQLNTLVPEGAEHPHADAAASPPATSGSDTK
jgi:outer membrane protein TolC